MEVHKNLPFPHLSSNLTEMENLQSRICKLSAIPVWKTIYCLMVNTEVPAIGDFPSYFNNCGAYGQSLSPDFILKRKETISCK